MDRPIPCGARCNHLTCDREPGHPGSHRGYDEQRDAVLWWPEAPAGATTRPPTRGTMPKQDDKIGALWTKQTRDLAEYMSGEIEIDGRKHRIVVFRNGFKETDRQPSHIIYRGIDRP